ncbi:unnamed protein product [Urochloa humidicola]
MGSLRKKAIDASTKISRSLKKTRGKSGSPILSVSIEDLCDLEERKLLRHLGRCYFVLLLCVVACNTARHDDYQLMLIFMKARKMDIEKAKQMWSGMLQSRKEYGTDTIVDD